MMKTMGRDDVERGPRGRGRGCCGDAGCCGGHGRGPHREREEETASRRRTLEERQRDLEEALAEVTSELADLGAEGH
ncbi:MAG: hypothetical protein M0Z42_08425 [Actinomycetota bacterium]|nr:hypothetical protein [Actinomycetota bacterium]